ncbi:MAG TPA: sugar transferase [Thermomicrobiales bacterium]|nr:sugar transferase [Thermomicrobiales bacterium]
MPRPSVRERASLRLALIFQTIALFADVGAVFLAFRLGYALRYRLEFGGEISNETWASWSTFSVTATVAAAILLVVFPLRGVYQVRQKLSLLDLVPRIIGGWAMVLAGIIMLAFFFQFTRSRLIFVYVGVLGLAFMLGHRLVASTIRDWLWRHGIGADRVLVVGEGAAGRRLMQSIIRDAGLGYRLIGYAGNAARGDKIHVATERGILTCPRLGSVDDVHALVARHQVDEIMIVEDRADLVDVRHILDQCRGLPVQFRIVPDLLQISLDRVDVAQIDGIPTIGVRDASIRGWNAIMKRAVDIAIAMAVCLVGLIPSLVVAVLIKRDSRGPVLYRQIRIGQYGEPFTMLKFRCMVENADEMWEQLASSQTVNQGRLFKDPDDPRITRIGRVLRRYSLDELPQMLNVLKGDMSVVGPRPPLPREVDEYEEWHLQRLLVRPGLTGLWQVNGRSDLNFDEMVRLDLYYAENWSPWLDIKVLLRTIPAVLLGRGAY